MSQCSSELDSDAQQDAEARAKYGEAWRPLPAATAAKPYWDKIASFRATLGRAGESDQVRARGMDWDKEESRVRQLGFGPASGIPRNPSPHVRPYMELGAQHPPPLSVPGGHGAAAGAGGSTRGAQHRHGTQQDAASAGTHGRGAAVEEG